MYDDDLESAIVISNHSFLLHTTPCFCPHSCIFWNTYKL